MKPNEYIEKYNLEKVKWFDHPDFVRDLKRDFLEEIEKTKKSDGSYSLSGIDAAVRVARQKFDAISNKISNKLPEKLWSFFFATVVAPERDSLCGPEFKERMEKGKREYEERQAKKKLLFNC